MCHFLESEIRALYFDLLSKDVNQEVKGLQRLKLGYLIGKEALLNHLQVQEVINEAQKQIHLRNDNENHPSQGFIKYCL